MTPIKRDAQLVEKYGEARVRQWLAPMLSPARAALLQRVVAARRVDLTLLLDRFYDPHNNAAVLRSAEAFGLSTLHVVPGAQGASFSGNVSQGVEKWIDHVVHDTTEQACDALLGEGYVLVGADVAGVPCAELPPWPRVCVVLGAEKAGLSAVARARCKAFVTIPMVGMVESFNVSVAAALLTQAMCARPAEHLSASAQRVLLARYMVQTIQRPELVLEELSERS